LIGTHSYDVGSKGVPGRRAAIVVGYPPVDQAWKTAGRVYIDANGAANGCKAKGTPKGTQMRVLLPELIAQADTVLILAGTTAHTLTDTS
jgi:hypothetical protein